ADAYADAFHCFFQHISDYGYLIHSRPFTATGWRRDYSTPPRSILHSHRFGFPAEEKEVNGYNQTSQNQADSPRFCLCKTLNFFPHLYRHTFLAVTIKQKRYNSRRRPDHICIDSTIPEREPGQEPSDQ